MNPVAKTESVLLTIWEHDHAACLHPKSYPDLLRDMTEISQTYLGADAELQGRMRQVFDLGGGGWYVLAYIKEMANTIKSAADMDCLTNALAAASLGGDKVEDRELDSYLQYLYSKARAVGLDPGPHFLQVAEFSSTKPGWFGFSPADLFRAVAKKMPARNR